VHRLIIDTALTEDRLRKLCHSSPLGDRRPKLLHIIIIIIIIDNAIAIIRYYYAFCGRRPVRVRCSTRVRISVTYIFGPKFWNTAGNNHREQYEAAFSDDFRVPSDLIYILLVASFFRRNSELIKKKPQLLIHIDNML